MKSMSLALSLAGLSFMMTVIWGTPLLRVLRHFEIGKIIRVDEPGFHQVKMGTPTMGGVMFILPVALITVMLNAVSIIGMENTGRSILVPVIVMFAYALLGALDDWEGVRGKRRGDGMRARTKFAIQVILALLTATVLKYILDVPELIIPGVQVTLELGAWYVPVAAFIIIGGSNAINFTDGLDGLAGLIAATAFITYGGIAMLQGQIFVGRFCFTLVGALFGFLWFNVHPASLFMGDTGSLSLGATLAVVALMTGQWAILPDIDIIPVSEALSVI
ncbi:MAG: phospho-N-acetylmuramoyl-pentapeptide-transferase, partial [Chloroflexi bacterium]